jgi:hypothetical protein
MRSMKKQDATPPRDLRDDVNKKAAADPAVARRLENMKPLEKVDEPHLVTPGAGNQVPGQTTHE